MEKVKEQNGLKLIKIKSQTKGVDAFAFEDLESVINSHLGQSNFSALLYLDYTVLIGAWESGTWKFPDNKSFDAKFIKQARIFNETQELYVWRETDQLKGRLRTDEEGEEIYAIEAKQVLFGTDVAEDFDKDGFTSIVEDRGTQITLPGNYEVTNGEKRVAVQSRNYIQENSLGQSDYCDVRLMQFCQING